MNRALPALIIIYFVLCLLLHTTAEKPFSLYVAKWGNASLTHVLNIAFALLLVGSGVILFRKVRSSQSKFEVWRWAPVLLGTLVSYVILMPYKSEGVHFLQFGILAILVQMYFKRSWISLNFVMVLGIIDELYQYMYGNSVYYDFNDMVLNFFGGCLGILFYNSMVQHRDDVGNRAGWYFYFIVGLPSLIILVGYLSGTLCLYVDGGCDYALFKWEDGRFTKAFWDSTDWGKQWHRIKVWEGVLLIPLLPLLYSPIFLNHKQLKK